MRKRQEPIYPRRGDIMLITWIAIFSLAALGGCAGSDEAHEEPRTLLALTAADINRLDLISVIVDGETFGTLGNHNPGSCESPSLTFPVEKEEVRILAQSAQGFSWDLNVALEAGDCNEVQLSLENTSTGMLACFAMDMATAPIELIVGRESVGVAVRSADNEDMARLRGASEGDLRRLLFELRSKSRAVLFWGQPGKYPYTCGPVDSPGPSADTYLIEGGVNLFFRSVTTTAQQPIP